VCAADGLEFALVMGKHASRRGYHMDPYHLPRSLPFLSAVRSAARRIRP
jgi:hypothetical protein